MNNNKNFGGDQDDISEITDIQFGEEHFMDEEEGMRSSQVIEVLEE